MVSQILISFVLKNPQKLAGKIKTLEFCQHWPCMVRHWLHIPSFDVFFWGGGLIFPSTSISSMMHCKGLFWGHNSQRDNFNM